MRISTACSEISTSPTGSSNVSLVGPTRASCPNPRSVPQRRITDASVIVTIPFILLCSTPIKTQPSLTINIFFVFMIAVPLSKWVSTRLQQLHLRFFSVRGRAHHEGLSFLNVVSLVEVDDDLKHVERVLDHAVFTEYNEERAERLGVSRWRIGGDGFHGWFLS